MEAAVGEEETEHALFSRSNDLLRGFCGGFSADELTEEADDGDSDEIDLGLSLGGCFSSADSKQKRIARSSSIPTLLPSGLQPVTPLSRACSLPSETVEEMWRRKEMQSINRVDAKRKMGDRNGWERFEEDLEGGSIVKFRKLEVPTVGSWIKSGGAQSRDFSPAISSWITEAMPPEMSGKSIPPASHGSIASQGSSSPGRSESESRPRQGSEVSGFGTGSEVRPAMAEHKNHKTASFPSAEQLSKPVKSTAIAAIAGGLESGENPSRKKDGGRRGDARSVAGEMPLVSTGGNGRRTQGFLYRYGCGEVRIVCVCHGSFLTPAEFVKHGGGGDVAHPLKHILVNPSSPPFL